MEDGELEQELRVPTLAWFLGSVSVLCFAYTGEIRLKRIAFKKRSSAFTDLDYPPQAL